MGKFSLRWSVWKTFAREIGRDFKHRPSLHANCVMYFLLNIGYSPRLLVLLTFIVKPPIDYDGYRFGSLVKEIV